jgi:hypothetical protein
MVRALFPADENEELWADLAHSLYCETPEDE